MVYPALQLILPNQIYLPVAIASVRHLSIQLFVEHHHFEENLLSFSFGRFADQVLHVRKFEVFTEVYFTVTF